MNIHRWLWQAGAVSFLAVSMAFCLSGCGSAGKQSGEQTEESISAQPLEEGSDIMEGDSSQEDWILGGAGILPGEGSEYETAPEETEPEPDPAPEYYRGWSMNPWQRCRRGSWSWDLWKMTSLPLITEA